MICSGMIYSKNTNYAYKVRTKTLGLGINTQYIRKIDELLDYVLKHDEGIIFIDINNERFQKYAKEFALLQRNKNLSIVYLTDNIEVKVDCDSIYTFQSSYDELQNVIPSILNIRHSRHNNLDSFCNVDIDKYLSLIIKEFQLPEKLTGYNYIYDCVKVFLQSREKKYNIIKEAYTIVANRYKKNVSNIEKSIRTVISKAVQKSPEPFRRAFKNDKVSNLNFIVYLVEKVKTMHYWNSKHK